jgi:hypothetical protein
LEKIPQKITERFIIQNAEYTLESSSREWEAWIWEQLVLLKVSGNWESKNYNHYFSEFWDIFCERKRIWDRVYFIIDANDMEIQTEEFRQYLKESWMHLLDREDLSICLVEAKAMKRLIWKSIYQLIGNQDRVRIFQNFSEAFAWIRGRRVKNGA